MCGCPLATALMMPPAGSRTQMASCVSLKACTLPRNESSGRPSGDTYATLIILPRARAVLTVSFNAGESFSSVLSGFAMGSSDLSESSHREGEFVAALEVADVLFHPGPCVLAAFQLDGA